MGTNDNTDIFSGNRNNKNERKKAVAENERRASKKTTRIAILIIAVLAVLFAGALYLNSNYIRRTLPAVTVGGRDFSASEYDYFFSTSLFRYQQTVWEAAPDFAHALLPQQGVPLRNQIQNHETGGTWADFIHVQTVEMISNIVQLYNAARDYGFVLTDAARYDMEQEILAFQEEIFHELQGRTFEDNLRVLYGRGMNEAAFRELYEFIFTAGSFSEHMRDSFTFTQHDLDEYYEENRDNLDNFTFRQFVVWAEIYDFDDEDNIEAAFDEARRVALEISTGIGSHDTFITAAFNFDPFSFGEPDSTLRMLPGSELEETYASWMQDSTRTYGDMLTVDDVNGVAIIMFADRDGNDYRMAEMRQILIMREQVWPWMFEEGEEDPEYIEATESAEREMRERASTVYELFTAGGATEALLIELMDEHSDDFVPGGHYTEITKMHGHNKMVPEIEDWLFAPGRSVGDFALIETHFGYHLVYFSGHGKIFRDFLADSSLRNTSHGEWIDGFGMLSVDRRWGLRLTSQW